MSISALVIAICVGFPASIFWTVVVCLVSVAAPPPPPPPPEPEAAVVVVAAALTVSVLETVKSVWTGDFIVPVIAYVPAVDELMVKSLFTRAVPEIAVFACDDGVHVVPAGQSSVMLNVVAESPRLFIAIVYVDEPPDVMLLELSDDVAVRLAGDNTERPVCFVSERLPLVPESVAVTLTVIPFE